MALFDASMFGPEGLWPFAGDLPMRSDAPWMPEAAAPALSFQNGPLPFWRYTVGVGPTVPMAHAPHADGPTAHAPQPHVEAPLLITPTTLPTTPDPGAAPLSPFDRLINGVGASSNMLMGAGAALMSGQGFDGALKGAMTGMQADRQHGSSQRQQRALIQSMLAPRSGWAVRRPRR